MQCQKLSVMLMSGDCAGRLNNGVPIYILQSFVFSRENYDIFCIVCTFMLHNLHSFKGQRRFMS